MRPEPIRFARLDSEHPQSDGKSVNRGLPVLPQKERGLWVREWSHRSARCLFIRLGGILKEHSMKECIQWWQLMFELNRKKKQSRSDEFPHQDEKSVMPRLRNVTVNVLMEAFATGNV